MKILEWLWHWILRWIVGFAPYFGMTYITFILWYNSYDMPDNLLRLIVYVNSFYGSWALWYLSCKVFAKVFYWWSANFS